MFDFSHNTVIVTGASRGIGKSIALAFLKAGARVIGTYHSNVAALEQFYAESPEYRERLDFQKFNVGVYAEVEKFFHYIEERYENKIEILVNNSGIRKDGLLAMMKPEHWDEVLQTNLSGVSYMSKFAVLAMLRKRYGRIINITSPSGKFGFPGQTNYSASKAGLVGFTRALAQEVASRKITVNCVSPGFITTDLIQDLSEELKESYLKTIPLKRFGTPEEVSSAVLFLASSEASYITGTVLEVTGGL
jgi:3-oxoacyl-[acyl-carrier protein] reductase